MSLLYPLDDCMIMAATFQFQASLVARSISASSPHSSVADTPRSGTWPRQSWGGVQRVGKAGGKHGTIVETSWGNIGNGGKLLENHGKTAI